MSDPTHIPAALELAPMIPTMSFVAMLLCAAAGFFKLETFQRVTGWLTVATIALGFVITLAMLGPMYSAATAAAEAGHATTGYVVHYFEWINIGDFSANFSFFIDPLTIIMLIVITGIGSLIAAYAAWYMDGDKGYWRFFTYINLFIFSMTCLVMADNLLLLYLGWEGVGAASYLLIGFYYRKPAAVAAAKKAFIVNRVGDFGFALGLMGVFVAFGSIAYMDILPAASAALPTASATDTTAALTTSQYAAFSNLSLTEPAWLIAAIPFLLMLGAFGKSAQLPLHVWLPDAMEGPTPVSALIHAATMVTAGIYMIARLTPIFMLSPYALPTVAAVGAVTAIFAATIALCQYDLKRVWAYSTLSQLGYMFLGVGAIGAYGGVFHVFTHAFFKALLFLTAGSVMHAMAGQLDLRYMSGLRHKMPVTAVLTLIGCLALAGVPLMSGFFSKDAILADALTMYPMLGWIGIITALLTAFYTFRVYFRVFLGDEHYEMGREHHGYVVAKDDPHAHDLPHHPHESPKWVNGVLAVLAVGAIFAGYLGTVFIKPMLDASTAHVSHEAIANIKGMSVQALEDAHDHNHSLAMWIASVGGILMIALAYYFHAMNREATAKFAASPGVSQLVRFFNNKWGIDEAYESFIRRPLRGVGWFCYRYLDQFILDRTIIDRFIGGAPRWIGAMGRVCQGGQMQSYALTMGVGLVVILLVVAMKLLAS